METFMKNYFNNIVSIVLDILVGDKCPNCKTRGHLGKVRRYTRGYNHLCTQAVGDDGRYCMKCEKIVFKRSYEEYASKLPEWVEAYPDSNRRTHHPDFKKFVYPRDY